MSENGGMIERKRSTKMTGCLLLLELEQGWPILPSSSKQVLS